MLSQLSTIVSKADCAGVSLQTVKDLAHALRENPRYSKNSLYNQLHHKLLASIVRREDNVAATIEHLNAAMDYAPSTELNMMMVTTLAGAGDFTAANAFIEDALEKSPRHPLRAIAWRRNLRNLREYVAELERYSRDAQRKSNEDS